MKQPKHRGQLGFLSRPRTFYTAKIRTMILEHCLESGASKISNIARLLKNEECTKHIDEFVFNFAGDSLKKKQLIIFLIAYGADFENMIEFIEKYIDESNAFDGYEATEIDNPDYNVDSVQRLLNYALENYRGKLERSSKIKGLKEKIRQIAKTL